MWKQQSFKIKSQEFTGDYMEKWYILKQHICCPVLSFFFCYRAPVGYYEKKHFYCLLTAQIFFFFLIFKNCLTKHSLPYLVRFLYLFSLYSVDFKEDKRAVTEAVSFLAIFSQKVWMPFPVIFFLLSWQLVVKKINICNSSCRHLSGCSYCMVDLWLD